jgi:hypothetical protein
MRKPMAALALSVALLAGGALWGATPTKKPAAVEGAELLEMLIAILGDSGVGPGDGWFRPSEGRYSWAWLADRHGIDPKEAITKDAFLGRPELFDRLDRNKDGVLRADDFDWSPPPRPRRPPPPGAMPPRSTLLMGLLTGEIGSAWTGPKVGDLAPDFTLRTQDGQRQISLSEHRGKRPVVLIFGSFT